MKRFSFFPFFWQIIAVCLFSAAAGAQNLPEDAPILISQPDSTRALTAVPTRKGFDFAPRLFQAGGAEVTLFVTNLELLPEEGASAFRVDIQDARRVRYPLQVVSFEPLEARPWVYALTVRFNERMENVGDVLVRVNWRGMASNRVRVALGFESKKPEDDAGAVPTPMPDKPIIRSGDEQQRGSLPWAGDRVRFMEQAAFGPNAALEMRLRRVGFSAWLNEQMEEKRDASGAIRFSTFPYPNLPLMPTNIPTTCTGICLRDNYSMYPLQKWFFREALYGEDQQLRRRVSWALSQIWVVSGRETVQPSGMLPYIQVLDRHAFGNYRELMREMTLNPAMGNYLDMAISTRQSPNENYAREILQLFSIGLFMLNQDGTLKLDAEGNPIPTYTQEEVNGFTKVFTGWTLCGQDCPDTQPGIRNMRAPMVLNPQNHDTTEKQVLNYPGASSIIPAGLSAEQEFELALDNIFYHPNVAPFVSKILIQQLVTSNPTPAYVGRVAAIFNDNGQGIRGDLKAVIRAILLDPEARGNVKTDPDYGKLREPVLFVTNLLRPFNPTANINAPGVCSGQSDGVLNGVTITLDQDVFNPPSVFNYYPLTYTLQNTALTAPEFGIFSTGTALKRPNFVNQMVFQNGVIQGNDTPCGTRIDLSRWQSLAADLTGNLLLETVNREFLHGSMSAPVRAHILQAMQAVAADNPLKRARTALYLVTTSPQFQVQR